MIIRSVGVGWAVLLLASVGRCQTLDLGTRLELFIDEEVIGELTGDVRQHLHLPEPKEVVLVTDAPWEGNTSAYYTIFQDGPLFRMYYRGTHYDEVKKKGAHPEVVCYAESRDGIHWEKPNLGLIEFDGSRENNIVWDGIGSHCFTPFKDENPDCPPDVRYKAVSRGRPHAARGLYIYGSPDGLRWRMLDSRPVITDGAFDSQNLAFWDPQLGRYRAYHRTFVDKVRAIMASTSEDFRTWTEPELLRYPGVPAEHLYTNAIRPYVRAPHLLIGFPTRYLPAEGQRVEPTLMVSRDGVTFRRWLEPVIPESAPEDRAGNRSNYMAWGMLELPGRPDHLSVYASEAYYTGPDSRLRRFEYRKDGFVSVRAGDAGGELLTKPIRLSELAERLVVNFVTQEGGSIEVALESPDGKEIDGFGLEGSEKLSGDRIRHTVAWKKGSDLSVLEGGTVRLRFRLKNADLFSLQFQPWL